MDRISQLPDPLLHVILSLLPIRDILRTRILSTRWHRLFDSLTWWNFDQRQFLRGWNGPSQEEARRFMEFTRRSLRNQARDGIFASKINIHVYNPYCWDWLTECIDVAIDGHVKELTLNIERHYPMYALPPAVFTSRSLTILDLKGCTFGELAQASGVGNRTLQKLSLIGVQVCEAVLGTLLKCFPFVEDLTIRDCSPIRLVSISGLPKLKAFDVKSQRVEIDAPTLQRLRIEKTLVDFSKLRDCMLGLSAIERQVVNSTLRKLSLISVQVSEAEFCLLLNCFPFLEDLTIRDCFPLRSISVSGLPGLKILDVRSKRVEIDAPTLHRLRLEGVLVDEDVFGNIVAKFPFMEDVVLIKPRKDKRHYNWDNLELEQLNIRGLSDVDSLEMRRGEGRGGETDVKLRGRRDFRFRFSPPNVSLILISSDVSLRLKEMAISGSCIDPYLLYDGFFSRFPLLEKLRVSQCPTVLRINFFSSSLKSVCLDNIHQLEDVRIEAPKLCSFRYSGYRPPLVFSVCVPCPVEFVLKPVFRHGSFFFRLNSLLSALDHTAESTIRIILSGNFPPEDMSELRRRCIQPSARHKIMVGGRGCSELPLLADALLRSCRPRSLTVCPGFPKEFVEVLYEKVTGPNDWNVEMEKLSLSWETGWLRRWSSDTRREDPLPPETIARLLINFPGSEALFKLHWPEEESALVDKGLPTEDAG